MLGEIVRAPVQKRKDGADAGTRGGVAAKCLSDKLIVYSLPLKNEGETLY